MAFSERLPSVDALRSMFLLEGRTALITGGAAGLGEAIAFGFASLGANVAIVDRDTARAEATSASIATATGRKVLPLTGSVSSESDVSESVQATIAEFGHIDVLVNNAGYNFRKPLVGYTADEFDELYAVHARGTFLFCRAVGQHMKDRRSGSIINMASILALVGAVNTAPYAAAKAAIRQLTRVFALEMAPVGVRVNAIAPGYFETAITQTHEVELRDHVCRLTPFRRYGDRSEIIGPAAFLASDASSFVTGITMTVDGGWTAQ